MRCVLWFLWLLTTVLVADGSTLLGGRAPLSNEDFGLQRFGELVEKANHKCNIAGGRKIWYKQDAILKGTKQMVSGVLYEFSLRQRATQCNREDLFKSDAPQRLALCASQTNSSTAICSVKIWHQEWQNNTEITVNEFWHVDTNDGIISETVRVLDPSKHGAYQTLIDDAIVEFNQRPEISQLHKFTKALKTVRRKNGEKFTTIKVDLVKTSCPLDKQKKYFQYDEQSCYAEDGQDTIPCTLELKQRITTKPSFTGCKTLRQLQRGLWRAPPATEGSQQSCPGENAGKGKPEPHYLKNFARSDVRKLSYDEIHDTAFQELLAKVIKEYKAWKNSSAVYTIQKVDNVKVEYEPKKSTHFTLWAVETPYKEPTSTAGEELEGKMPEQPPTDQVIEQCQISVFLDEKNDVSKTNITFSDCKEARGYSGPLIGGLVYVKPGRKDTAAHLALALSAVEQYNSQSNDIYVYTFHGVQNTFSQVVAGTEYTMNITMKANSCKNSKDQSCFSPGKQVFLHCMISAVEAPWINKREINITDCWRRILLLKSVDGSWVDLSPEEMQKMRDDQAVIRIVEAYRGSLAQHGEVMFDYLTDGYKIKSTEAEILSLQVHLKGTETKQPRFECPVFVIRVQGEPDKETLGKCIKKPPPPEIVPMMTGTQKNLGEKEQKKRSFQSLIRKVVERYNKMVNDHFYYRLLRIGHGYVQVVAGQLTTLELHLQATNCTKNKHSLWQARHIPHTCGKLNTTHVTFCTVKIWEKPWENFVNIDIEKCQSIELTLPNPVQFTTDDLQATEEFKDLLSSIDLLFNLISEEKVLYQSHSVDGIKREASKPDDLEFNVTLRPTACRKWDDLVWFKEGRYQHCGSEKFPQNFVTCTAKVTEIETVASIQLSNCEYIHHGMHSLRRPQHGAERAAPEFQQVVERSVKVFNAMAVSPYWFTQLAVENPTVEHVCGPQYTFRLLLLPTMCRPSDLAQAAEKRGVRLPCMDEQPKFMVSCSARYWRRSWPDARETLDVYDCYLTPILEASEKRNTLLNQQCIKSNNGRFLQLFEDLEKPAQVYQILEIDSLEQSRAPGKRVLFELFLTPLETEKTCSRVDQETCSQNKHFYACKGAYWWKDWDQSENFELSHCSKVSPVLLKFEADATSVESKELEQLTDKAVKLYNERLAEFYIFGKEKVEDLRRSTDIGKKTSFTLYFKPIGCNRTLGRRICMPEVSKTRASCTVTVWERPWMGEGEQIWLRDCQDYFSQPDTEDQAISDEEKESSAFQDMLKKLGDLYAEQTPIVYKVDEVENVKKRQNSTHSVINMVVVFEPIGCNLSKPNASLCEDWQNQENIKCDAEVIQFLHEGGRRQLRLAKCFPEIGDSDDDLALPTDWDRRMFKLALRKAWELFHQTKPHSTHLYKIDKLQACAKQPNSTPSDINDRSAIIHEDKIKCTVTFEETVCLRGQDEKKFRGGYVADCEDTEPEVTEKCFMEVTSDEQRQTVSLACQVD